MNFPKPADLLPVIPKPADLLPIIRETETKISKLNTTQIAMKAECTDLRAELKDGPSAGNASDNRVRAILGEAPAPTTAPANERLQELLQDLQAVNSAIAVLNNDLYNQRNIGSKMVCDAIRPEVVKRAKVYADALLALYAANAAYDSYLDEVENTGVNISSLNRIFLNSLGSTRDPCGPYHYSLMDFVDAGVIARNDVPAAVR